MEGTDVFGVWMEMLERVISLGVTYKNVIIISLLQSSVESCNLGREKEKFEPKLSWYQSSIIERELKERCALFRVVSLSDAETIPNCPNTHTNYLSIKNSWQ